MKSWTLLALKLALEEDRPPPPHRPTTNKQSEVNITAELFLFKGLIVDKEAPTFDSFFPVLTVKRLTVSAL